MHQDDRDTFQAWLWGEVLLFGLLGAGLALFVAHPTLRTQYALPQLGLVISTMVMLAGALVVTLTGTRFTVEGRRFDLLLASGFFVASLSMAAFTVAPVLGGGSLGRTESWAAIWGRLLAWVLLAAAPFSRGRVKSRSRSLGSTLGFLVIALVVIWGLCRSLAPSLTDLTPIGDRQLPPLLMGVLAAQALLTLLALVGYGQRFFTRGEDLDRWLSLGATLMLFASLHGIFTPLRGSGYVSQADFLRLLGYTVLLVGVWRAIRFSEFGRAVADERARVAREIHDGLAQYLFAVSTHASMLETGADLAETLPRLKEAAAAAQQEAKFAVLALSSASGNAPFDSALRRYIDFLVADGALEVDLEIDKAMRLGPDEQIEVFRIVQEGLANARKHAGATRAVVWIGEREGERLVTVRDDGAGFEVVDGGAGQGLKNMRQRATSIGGAFRLTSEPGLGTALEVVLRA